MKHKYKINYDYKNLLLYTCLILNALAAKSFSTGITRSNLGSVSRFPGSPSRIGSSFQTTQIAGTPLSGWKQPTFIPIKQPAFNPFFNAAKAVTSPLGAPPKQPIFFPTKQPAYNPFYAGPKTELNPVGTTPVQTPLTPAKQPAFNPFYTGPKKEFNAVSTTPPLPPTRQPAYNPFYTGPKKDVNQVDAPLMQPPFISSKQPAFNKFYNATKKELYPVSAHPFQPSLILSKPPAYYPFYYDTKKEDNSVGVPSKQPPFIPSMDSEYNQLYNNTESNLSKTIYQKIIPTISKANKPSTMSKLNSTRSTHTNGTHTNTTFLTSPLDFIYKYSPLKALNLNAKDDGEDRTIRGYTGSTINRNHVYKTQQDTNKELQNQKPSLINSLLISMSIALIIMAIFGVVIFFKLKKKYF